MPGKAVTLPSGKKGVRSNGKSAVTNSEGNCPECCDDGSSCLCCIEPEEGTVCCQSDSDGTVVQIPAGSGVGCPAGTTQVNCPGDCQQIPIEDCEQGGRECGCDDRGCYAYLCQVITASCEQVISSDFQKLDCDCDDDINFCNVCEGTGQGGITATSGDGTVKTTGNCLNQLDGATATGNIFGELNLVTGAGFQQRSGVIGESSIGVSDVPLQLGVQGSLVYLFANGNNGQTVSISVTAGIMGATTGNGAATARVFRQSGGLTGLRTAVTTEILSATWSVTLQSGSEISRGTDQDGNQFCSQRFGFNVSVSLSGRFILSDGTIEPFSDTDTELVSNADDEAAIFTVGACGGFSGRAVVGVEDSVVTAVSGTAGVSPDAPTIVLYPECPPQTAMARIINAGNPGTSLRRITKFFGID